MFEGVVEAVIDFECIGDEGSFGGRNVLAFEAAVRFSSVGLPSSFSGCDPEQFHPWPHRNHTTLRVTGICFDKSTVNQYFRRYQCLIMHVTQVSQCPYTPHMYVTDPLYQSSILMHHLLTSIPS